MEEEYTVAVPVSLHQAYANLEAELGWTITEDDKSNINHIYTMIAGTAGGDSYSGELPSRRWKYRSTWTSPPLLIPPIKMQPTL